MPVICADPAAVIDRHVVAEASTKAKATARICAGCGAACAAIVEAIHRGDDGARSDGDHLLAVHFTPQAGFDQTPGPRAGQALATGAR